MRVGRYWAVVLLALMMVAPTVGTYGVVSAQGDAPDELAYVRNGEIWLAGVKGSDQRSFGVSVAQSNRERPVLSADGTLLALADPFQPGRVTVWSLADGVSTEVVGSEGCRVVEFNATGEQLSLTCPADTDVTFVTIDLQDQTVVREHTLPGSRDEELTGFVDYRPADGLMLVEQMRDTDEGQGSLPTFAVIDSNLKELFAFESVEIEGERQHLWSVRFAPEGEELVATVCVRGCTYREESVYQDFLVSFEGELLGRITPDWMARREGYRIAWPNAAGLPLLDAAPAAEESPAVTAAPIVAVTEAVPDPPGWVAYVDLGGGVWIMRPDGSERTQLMADPPGNSRYAVPGQIAWSHDGTMLAFNGPTDPPPALDDVRGIWIYRNGQAQRLPNTGACAYPAFSADNSRLFYTCWSANLDLNEVGSDTDDPTAAFLTSSAIDGSDQRAEIRYDSEPLLESWQSDDGAWLQGTNVDVNPEDGSLLIRFRGPIGESRIGTMLLNAEYDPQLIVLTEAFGSGDVVGMYREFLPDGRVAHYRMCANGCANGKAVLLQDKDGNEFEHALFHDAIQFFSEFTIAPDGRSLIGWTPLDGGWMVSETGMTGEYTGQERALAWQPVAVAVGAPVAEPVDLVPGATSAEIPAESAAETDAASPGWIAYASLESEGGAIWIVRPDGSEAQAISDDLPYFGFENPAWSHDGTMLAFNGPTLNSLELQPYYGIWILREGVLTQLPETEFCGMPFFSADNDRLYFRCWVPGEDDPTPADLANNPYHAVLTSSALDGSDIRAEFTYLDEFDGGGFYDPAGGRLAPIGADVNPEDGSILLSMMGLDDGEGNIFYVQFVFDADRNLIARYDTIGWPTYRASSGGVYPTRSPLGFFLPGGEVGYVEFCPEDCGETPTYTVVDHAGNPLDYPLLLEALRWDVTAQQFSPDGMHIVRWTAGPPRGLVIESADGTVVPFAPGLGVAWQPVPAEIDLP